MEERYIQIFPAVVINAVLCLSDLRETFIALRKAGLTTKL